MPKKLKPRVKRKVKRTIYPKYSVSKRNFKDPKYKAWRKAVYSRDGYKCKWPGCNYKSRLNAHHIRRWATYPTLRFIVENGITLCEKHHELIKRNEDHYIAMFLQILGYKNV